MKQKKSRLIGVEPKRWGSVATSVSPKGLSRKSRVTVCVRVIYALSGSASRALGAGHFSATNSEVFESYKDCGGVTTLECTCGGVIQKLRQIH